MDRGMERQSWLDDVQDQEPTNWKEQLMDFDWQSNLKALQLELDSPHNFRWELTLQVTVVWPAMRKWALQTLQKCLTGRARHLTKEQRKQFLNLFEKCPMDKLTQLTFIEPVSIVENIETVTDSRKEQSQSPPMEDDYVDDIDKDEAVSNFGSQIWSIDPGNVDPFFDRTPGGDTLSMGYPGEPSFEDWEPDELKALDWEANMDALEIELNCPYNHDWDIIETINIKNMELRQWARETLVECLDLSHRLPDAKRKEFLSLLDKMPKNSMRRLNFQEPISIEDDFGQLQLDGSTPSGKNTSGDVAREKESDDSSGGSSVYL